MSNLRMLGDGYATVVADPPWPYRDAGQESSTLVKPEHSRFRKDGTLSTQVNDWTYKPMPIDEICALPVKTMVQRNAHLYLWTTNAFMDEAHDVARAWGFKPKTILTWVKIKKDRPEPSMKTGYYFRGATEHVLFCVRGSLRTEGTWPTAYMWPRLPHSAKPDEFFSLVEKASPGPYLEMFSRKWREGWVVWGDQVLARTELAA